MNYELKFLNKNQTQEIHQCMMEAFSDYAVDMSYMTHERMVNRHIKNGVNYELSVAAYFNDKMVGHTAIGIDDWQGEKAAFDASTGIIKEHRGKGLAKKMFDFAKEKLILNDVKKFLLEVLHENEAAIKAYKKTGFEIVRSFDSFEIKTNYKGLQINDSIEIKELSRNDINDLEHFSDWHPSWENSFNSIRRIPNEVTIIGAFKQNKCIGFLIFYPHLEWVLIIAVDKSYRRQKIGSTLLHNLLTRVRNDYEVLKLHNSTTDDKGFYQFVTSCGFNYIGGQYEMEMKLSAS